MSGSINHLPVELILVVLSHLPLESLISFGETSRANYQYHLASLKCLRLAVFQRRIHSVVSFLQAGWATPDELMPDDGLEVAYAATVIQHRTGSGLDTYGDYYPGDRSSKRRKWASEMGCPKSLKQTIRAQNDIFSKLLNRYGQSLDHLEFMAYDLDTDGAIALGTNCRHSLHRLALRFEHPHVRDGIMRPSTWLRPGPGSTAWNALIGIGPYKSMGLRSLETLVLERSGITPWQLSILVKNNPRLTTLKLRTCSGAQPEFLDWLGGCEVGQEYLEVAPGARLKVLWLENCQQLLSSPIPVFGKEDESLDSGLEWIRGLRSLRVCHGPHVEPSREYGHLCRQSLSLRECRSIPAEYVDRANASIWKIPEVILPYSLQPVEAPIIEVDPLLK